MESLEVNVDEHGNSMFPFKTFKRFLEDKTRQDFISHFTVTIKEKIVRNLYLGFTLFEYKEIYTY